MFGRARRQFVPRALRAVSGLLAMATLGCADFLAVLPDGAVPFEPPPIYRIWWAQTMACANISRSFDEINFYVVEGAQTINVGGTDAAGGFYQHKSRIVMAGDYQFAGPSVRHEMLHALIPNNSGHPREYFLHRCGDVVVCANEGCRQSAGPPFPLPPGIVEIPAESLLVSSKVSPTSPSRAATGYWIMLSVSATNPRPYPVVVRFAEDSLDAVVRPWGYEVSNPGGGLAFNSFMYDDGFRYFRAGETKLASFDFSIIGSRVPGALPLGPNTFTAKFGGLTAPPIPIIITP